MGRANADSIRYATNSEAYEKAMKEIQSDDAYELMVDKWVSVSPAIGKEAMEGDFYIIWLHRENPSAIWF